MWNIYYSIIALVVINVGIDNTSQTVPVFAQELKSDINVIVIGNPSEIPYNEKSMLPTGYSWVTKESKDTPLNFSGKADDPNALFVLEDGITDVPRIMEWAKENNKKNIYFFYDPPVIYPDGELPPSTPLEDFAEYTNKATNYIFDPFKSINFSEISEVMFNFLIPPAYANNCQPRTCTTGHIHPAAECLGVAYSNNLDDDPNDGRPISVRKCFMYESYSCHTDCMHAHLQINSIAWDDATSNVKALPDCMKFYNGANSHKQPVNLTIRVWASTAALDHPNRCGQEACGCAPGSPGATQCGPSNCNVALPTGTLTIYDKTIHVAEPCERNGWGITRHEMLHQYGYGHCHMDKDLRKTSRCIDGKKGGPCNLPSGQSNPPDHRYY